ncbi:hypothetical protein AB0O69_18405 [Streptomyces xiamenensis]|jgi:hypothetical protein|uniref:hypothetical protein n=1 Tax=Streptomyces xiamenensis TaxID=408015 RepID=UPI003426C9DB
MHYRNPEGRPRIGWFFATAHWRGEPVNAEPTKCAGIGWHHLRQLPHHTMPYNATGIAHYLTGDTFSVHGW